jgi:hypothetical protein
MVGTTLAAVLLGCREPPSSVTYSLTQTDPVVIAYPQPAENVTIEYFNPNFYGERATAVVSKAQHTRFLDSVPTGFPIDVDRELACVLAIYFKEGNYSPLVISVYYGDKPDEWLLGVFPDDSYYLIADAQLFEQAMSDLKNELGWNE